MDGWQVAQNWALFGVLVGGATTYYVWNRQQKPARRPSIAPASKALAETERKPKSKRRNGQAGKDAVASGSDAVKAGQKKASGKQPAEKAQTMATIIEDVKPSKESDTSNAQFAEMMAKARQGHNLSAAENKKSRVRTVKQGNAQDKPMVSSSSSQAGAEADDEVSPALSPSVQAGDVSDMLEPVSSGPSTLRLTAPAQPQKERVQRQPKEEVVESKKARQNRKRVEERRLQREAEEKERRQLEERQRRAAREARGEPAKNGIPMPKAPTTSPWAAQAAARTAEAPAVPTTLGNNAPLLDTFEAGSSASSNGGLEPDTAATSTTDDAPAQWEAQSEDDQMAHAMKQSEDESGWATVTTAKKGKKKTDGESAKRSTTSSKPTAPKPSANGNAKGFSALHVEEGANWDP